MHKVTVAFQRIQRQTLGRAYLRIIDSYSQVLRFLFLRVRRNLLLGSPVLGVHPPLRCNFGVCKTAKPNPPAAWTFFSQTWFRTPVTSWYFELSLILGESIPWKDSTHLSPRIAFSSRLYILLPPRSSPHTFSSSLLSISRWLVCVCWRIYLTLSFPSRLPR